MYTCHNCGSGFTGHKRKFCSRTCGKRYNNRKNKGHDVSVYEVETPPTNNKPTILKCLNCSTPIAPPKRKYCTEMCGDQHWYKLKKESLPEAKCLNCYSLFKVTKNGGSSGTEYTTCCSKQCGAIYAGRITREKSAIRNMGAKVISRRVKRDKERDKAARDAHTAIHEDAKHNHCRKCGTGITQDSMQCCKRYCDQCREGLNREARRRARKANTAKYGKIKTHKKRAEKYGVPYEVINRIKVFSLYGWKCASCNKDTPENIMKTYDNPDAPTLDHIVPISKGGPHTYSNIQLLCRQCNITKSDAIEMLC